MASPAFREELIPEHDFCTIVSLLPFAVKTTKPSLMPGQFYIPPAPTNSFSTLVVKPSRSHVYIDEKRGNMIQHHAAAEIANSIVEDHWKAQLAALASARPGLFVIRGIPTDEEIVEKHIKMIEMARESQVQWFKRLVELADDDWSRNQQHKMIADIQREAARFLKLERAWVFEPEKEEKISCPACNTTVMVTQALCHNCRCIINEDRFKGLKFGTLSTNEE